MHRWGGGVLVLGGDFSSRRGYLLPVDVRGAVSYKSRVYTTRPDSLQNCRDVLYKVMGVGETLTEVLPSAQVRRPYDVGARGTKVGYAERACSAQDEPA